MTERYAPTRVPRIKPPAQLTKYGFIAPAILLLIAFNVFPLFYTLVISFTDMKSFTKWEKVNWVRGENYGETFENPDYAQSIRTTALFVFAAVSIELILGFALALALREPFRGRGVVMTILMIPMMLSQAVMGIYWYVILNGNYGVLNQVLGISGPDGPKWLIDSDLKLISILMIDVWMWTPFMMLISLAALNSIPRHIYEAAEIDRASRWTVFRRITLPMCAPLLFLAVLLRTTDALKQFDLVMALMGPDDPATQTLSVKIFQVAMRGWNIGQGGAFAFVILIAVIAMATIFTRYIGYIQARQGRAAA